MWYLPLQSGRETSRVSTVHPHTSSILSPWQHCQYFNVINDVVLKLSFRYVELLSETYLWDDSKTDSLSDRLLDLFYLFYPFLVFCSDVMKVGFSKPWPETMAMITGKPIMSAKPLVEYFKPLTDWLEAENNKNDEVRGWPEYDWKPPSKSDSWF